VFSEIENSEFAVDVDVVAFVTVNVRPVVPSFAHVDPAPDVDVRSWMSTLKASVRPVVKL
jgi:hypothetical protein